MQVNNDLNKVYDQRLKTKFLRTTITGSEGQIIAARLNTQTGEIKPYDYRHDNPRIIARPRSDQSSSEEPVFWQLPQSSGTLKPKTMPATGDVTEQTKKQKRKRNRPGKEILNPYRGFTQYDSLQLCLARELGKHASTLENIFVGASHLEDGKKGSHSIELMFMLLRDLPVLSTKAIEAYTHYSENHCRKLFAVMRTVVRFIDLTGCLDSTSRIEAAFLVDEDQNGFILSPSLVQLDQSLYQEFLANKEAATVISLAKSSSQSHAELLT